MPTTVPSHEPVAGLDRQVGLATLAKALGPAGMVCFLQQDEHGAGGYTVNRYDLLGDADVASLVARIEAARRSGQDAPAQG